MNTTRRLAAIATIGVAAAVSAPAALAAPSADADSGSSTVSPVSYADRTMQEFGVGDDLDLQRDTTTEARSIIIEHDAASKHWKRTEVEGAAGHVYVTYVNTETQDHLTLGVKTTTGMHGDHLVNTAR